MGATNTTAEDTPILAATPRSAPGIVLLWTNHAPACRVFELSSGKLTIGRNTGTISLSHDDMVSNDHVELSREDGGWRVRDLGSRNGTFVDGERLTKPIVTRDARVMQVGHSVFYFADVGRFDGRTELYRDGYVVGPAMANVRAIIADAAEESANVVLVGETGVGKENAAAWYHACGPRPKGPCVALNVAAIPVDLAEAYLFGARKGVATGITETMVGQFASADGGTLFLDELLRMPREVQPKLLRAIETGVYTPLGERSPRHADVRVVCATNGDPEEATADGRFADDLYARLAGEEVRLPPLRDRIEEIPSLVAHFLSNQPGGIRPSAQFIAWAMLKPWSRNARQLRDLVRKCRRVARRAGAPFIAPVHADSVDPSPPQNAPATIEIPEGATLEDAKKIVVLRTLQDHEEDMSATAKALGIGRTTLYDMLEKWGMKKR